MAGAVLTPIGAALGDTTNIGWIISGWAIASSVSFSIAGRLSDIFGRRHIILFGQLLALIGGVSPASSPKGPSCSNRNPRLLHALQSLWQL